MNLPFVEMPLLEIENLEKSHGERFRLTVPALSFRKGTVTCIVGPTGAGKSTLLRLIATTDRPTAGVLRLEGEATKASRSELSKRRRLTMVFQRPMLLNASVRKNIEYGLRMRGTRDQSRQHVDQTIARLKLSELESRSAHTLSGGQMQLVALARALVLRPELLVLDEPSANLDPAHVALVEDVVAETVAAHATTVVWATHNMFQARRVADRVVLLLDGQIIEEADVAKFFDAPRETQTADFVQGRMIY